MNSQDLQNMYYSIQPVLSTSLVKYTESGREIRLFSGETLSPAELNAFIIYIKMGTLKIWNKRDNGETIDLCYCPENTCLQLNDLVINTDEWNIPFITATKNSIIIAFSKDSFYSFICNDRLLFDEYVNSASSYSTMLKQRIIFTAGLTSSQKILTWLDRLCQCSVPDSNGTYFISCSLTQQQIANLLFIHVSTCNKIFSKLASEHIAQYTRTQLIIYNLEEIRTLLEHDALLI